MDKFNKSSSGRASSAVESKPNNAEFDELEEKVFKAYQKKQYEECLELLEESLKIDPNNTNQRIIQAMCWANLDINGEETYEMFQQIINEEPNNSFAFYGMGFKNYSDGQLANAIPYLNRAIELNTTNAMQKAVELQQKATRFKEAICEANDQYEKNFVQKAFQILTAASFLDTNNVKVQKQISGLRQYFLSDLVENLETEVDAMVSEPLMKVEIEKAENLIDSCMLKEAEKIIEEIPADDTNALLVFVKGYLQYMTGFVDKAIPLLKQATALDPNHEKAKTVLANAEKIDELQNASDGFTSQKKHHESIKILTEILEVDENNKNIIKATYLQRAMAYFRLGNTKEAGADWILCENVQN